MITETTTTNGLTFYEFSIGGFCFLAFSLSELLKEIPKEHINQVLTQLN
jgi:hypothetical protein